MLTYRQDGKLIIELDEEELIDSCENHRHSPVKIFDKEQFLNHWVRRLDEITINEDDGPLMIQLLDELLAECAEYSIGCYDDYNGSYN